MDTTGPISFTELLVLCIVTALALTLMGVCTPKE